MGNLRAYTASLDTAIVVPGAEEAALAVELSVFRRFCKSHDRHRNSVITRTHINFECPVCPQGMYFYKQASVLSFSADVCSGL